MGSDKRLAVAMALTPDPELLPVVQGLVSGLAEQLGFGEGQRLNLQQGVLQACRGAMGTGSEDGVEELRLEFSGFADRLEIVVEEGEGLCEPSGADSFLLNQLLDRVSFEELAEGHRRLTLVKYLSEQRS